LGSDFDGIEDAPVVSKVSTISGASARTDAPRLVDSDISKLAGRTC